MAMMILARELKRVRLSHSSGLLLGVDSDLTVLEAERANRHKMPVYEGLPSNLELLTKMGECVLFLSVFV